MGQYQKSDTLSHCFLNSGLHLMSHINAVGHHQSIQTKNKTLNRLKIPECKILVNTVLGNLFQVGCWGVVVA